MERLIHIAHLSGESEEACGYLRRCLALGPVLRQVNPRRWKNIEPETLEAMAEAGCKGYNDISPAVGPGAI